MVVCGDILIEQRSQVQSQTRIFGTSLWKDFRHIATVVLGLFGPAYLMFFVLDELLYWPLAPLDQMIMSLHNAERFYRDGVWAYTILQTMIVLITLVLLMRPRGTKGVAYLKKTGHELGLESIHTGWKYRVPTGVFLLVILLMINELIFCTFVFVCLAA